MVSLVCLGNSLHVFQVNKDFTCFPKYVFFGKQWPSPAVTYLFQEILVFPSRVLESSDETILRNRCQRFAHVLRFRCDAERRWLSRTGTCPLSPSVTYPGYLPGEQSPNVALKDELTHEMFDIFLSFADRWRNVDFLCLIRRLFTMNGQTI